MHDKDITKSNALPNKVKIDLDVLGALMLDGVAGHVDRADVVAIDQRSALGEAHGAQGEVGAAMGLRQHHLPQRGTQLQHWIWTLCSAASTTRRPGCPRETA